MTTQEALFKYTLRLGDSSLILSHRLSEWTSKGPFLEEDLALTNIALDILGQAKSLLEYAAKVEDKGRTEDSFAYFRGEREFYNNLICEQPNGDYAKTIVRQFFVDTFDIYFYEALSKSKDETLAGIAAKSLKEIQYHLRHSSSWVKRFGDGTEESHDRAQDAINDLWSFTNEMFDMDEVDAILIKEGIAVDLNAVKEKWTKHVIEVIDESTLSLPETQFSIRGGKNGVHSEHLGRLLAEMQYLARMHPDATW